MPRVHEIDPSGQTPMTAALQLPFVMTREEVGLGRMGSLLPMRIL